jgi:hypothetical protein
MGAGTEMDGIPVRADQLGEPQVGILGKVQTLRAEAGVDKPRLFPGFRIVDRHLARVLGDDIVPVPVTSIVDHFAALVGRARNAGRKPRAPKMKMRQP